MKQQKPLAEMLAEFNSATPEQQRVIVARDVIQRLDEMQFTACVGDWLRFDNRWQLASGDSAQKKIHEGTKCSGCAVGGLLMSCTLFKNQVSIEESVHWRDAGEHISYLAKGGDVAHSDIYSTKPLTDLFSPAQLQLIEAAYEGGAGFFDNEATDYFEEDGDAGNEYRLRRIMENIIRNNGTFVVNEDYPPGSRQTLDTATIDKQLS